jgi:hypothetical protein
MRVCKAVTPGCDISLWSMCDVELGDLLKKPLVYGGALTGETDTVEAFSTALGFLSTDVEGFIHLSRAEIALSGGEPRLQATT